MKQNIRPIEDTSFLHQMEMMNFEYIEGCCDEDGCKQKQAGVIAEELELLKPELIIMQGNGVRTVDYQYLFCCAIKELQLLKKEIDAVKLALPVGSKI